MSDLTDSRGILYPARLPTFHREAAPVDLTDRIRWFWIPRWAIAPGRTSRQHLLPFPASNLVISPDGISLSGPTTRASHRDLQGTGWAVGALLRPAALATLHPDPQRIQGAEVPFHDPDLHAAVVCAMGDHDEEQARQRATKLYAEWARQHLAPPDDAAQQANAMEDLIASDPEIVRVDQIAHRLNISTRGVQRLARRYIGLTPMAVVRRYRLQEAAQRLREDPAATIAQMAADLGYADHAHFSTDFKAVLGATPSVYRRTAAAQHQLPD